ncbi:hypothetical protein VTO73DRAFT_7870 [Trametes versicolor]
MGHHFRSSEPPQMASSEADAPDLRTRRVFLRRPSERHDGSARTSVLWVRSPFAAVMDLADPCRGKPPSDGFFAFFGYVGTSHPRQTTQSASEACW